MLPKPAPIYAKSQPAPVATDASSVYVERIRQLEKRLNEFEPGAWNVRACLTRARVCWVPGAWNVRPCLTHARVCWVLLVYLVKT